MNRLNLDLLQLPNWCDNDVNSRRWERQEQAESHLIVDADEEEEGSVAPVHDLVVPVLHERTLQSHTGPSDQHEQKGQSITHPDPDPRKEPSFSPPSS